MYFIRANGHMYKLTKKAFKAWIRDNAIRPSKIKRYGEDLGEIIDVLAAKDFSQQDFVRYDKLYNED